MLAEHEFSLLSPAMIGLYAAIVTGTATVVAAYLSSKRWRERPSGGGSPVRVQTTVKPGPVGGLGIVAFTIALLGVPVMFFGIAGAAIGVLALLLAIIGYRRARSKGANVVFSITALPIALVVTGVSVFFYYRKPLVSRPFERIQLSPSEASIHRREAPPRENP